MEGTWYNLHTCWVIQQCRPCRFRQGLHSSLLASTQPEICADQVGAQIQEEVIDDEIGILVHQTRAFLLNCGRKVAT